jgi:hypothetical protein
VRPPTPSSIRVRNLPSVMLVRVDSPEVVRALERFGVRQVIPACERMRIMKPMLVLIGEDLRSEDVCYLYERAVELDADVLQPHLIPRSQLADRLYAAFLNTLRRRTGSRNSVVPAKSA